VNEGRPPAGWYPDPVGVTGRRYWDGSSWTAATAAHAADQTGGVMPPGTVASPAAGRAPIAPPTPPSVPSAPAGQPVPPGVASSGAYPPGGTWPQATGPRAGPTAVAAASAASTAGRLSPRVWAGIGAVLLVALIVLVRGGQTSDVTGTFEVVDDRYAYLADGASCSGAGGYSDIRAGSPVSVRSGAGDFLASGSLRGGYVEGLRCVFDFELIAVDRSDFYTFEVGRRGELTYSHAELAANGLHVDFYLGD
jgi:hypothetical protein